MTLKEWAEFNAPVCNQGDIIVCILKKGSYKTDDKLLEALTRLENAVEMFGDLELKKFQVTEIPHRELGTYHTIRVLLWK